MLIHLPASEVDNGLEVAIPLEVGAGMGGKAFIFSMFKSSLTSFHLAAQFS